MNIPSIRDQLRETLLVRLEMDVAYVREKCGEAVERLVIAKDIKSGLREAVMLLIYSRLHSGELPTNLQKELGEIIADATKRKTPESSMTDLEWTIHGMRIKTAQKLAGRIHNLYEELRDL